MGSQASCGRDIVVNFAALRDWRDILETWHQHSATLTLSDHAAALFRLGRAVRGRFAGTDVAHLKNHDSMQRGLQNQAAFHALLKEILQSASLLTVSQTSAALLGLGDTHEDLAFMFPSLPLAYRQLLLELTCALAGRQLGHLMSSGEAHEGCYADTRGLAHTLFALSNLNIFDEVIFRKSSQELAKRLRTSPIAFDAGYFNQWLFACFNVRYEIAEEDAEAVRHYPKSMWAARDTSRLVSLAASLLAVPSPDPLLAQVLQEIDIRPLEHVAALAPGLLYPLHVVRLLSEREPGLTVGRLAPASAKLLRDLVSSKCSLIQRVSRFEAEFHQALKGAGVQLHTDAGGQGKEFISADYWCELEGRQFCLEVNGPSHYLVSPARQPRGKTTLKARVFAAMRERLVMVPYWLFSPPEAYMSERESGEILKYSIDSDALRKEIVSQLDARRTRLARELAASVHVL